MHATENGLLEALENAQSEIDLLRSYCRNEMSERDQKRLATEMTNRGFDFFETQRKEIFRSTSPVKKVTTVQKRELPAPDATALQALPQDELAHNRLEELAFAKASEQLRQVAKDGDHAATQRALDALQKRFGQHPWLNAKIAQLRHLADEDTMLMAKEVRYSMMRMSSRLASKSEMAYSDDETHVSESVMPSFLRKKVSEGKGKVR